MDADRQRRLHVVTGAHYAAVDVAYFWARVDQRNVDECWPWKAALANGYGRLVARTEASKAVLIAPRVAFYLSYGYVPREVCHTCDHPPCCNPWHLWDGTHTENVQDASRKGRLNGRNTPRGESHGRAKLSLAQVVAIRDLVAAGSTKAAAARRFGVARSTVWGIVTGANWR